MCCSLHPDIRVQARAQPAGGGDLAAGDHYLQGQCQAVSSIHTTHICWSGSQCMILQEYSTDVGDPYYPVPNPRNQELYAKYQRLAEQEEGVTFVGRLASYKYFNMDQAILNALEFFDSDIKNLNWSEGSE